MAFPKLTPKRVLTALGAVALAVGTGLQLTRLIYEEPDFERVTKEGPFEVRRYRPRIVAETFVEADTRNQATSEGFRRLAGYIFGGNRDIAMTTPVEAEPAGGQRIAMTTPVEAAAEDGRWRIAFTMPSEYALADLPAPDDERVILREVPGELVAALRFSGGRDAAKITRLEDELRERLAGAGYEATSPITVAIYDPPTVVIPFLRRNELLVSVREGS